VGGGGDGDGWWSSIELRKLSARHEPNKQKILRLRTARTFGFKVASDSGADDEAMVDTCGSVRGGGGGVYKVDMGFVLKCAGFHT
jgi:hypothetical protein